MWQPKFVTVYFTRNYGKQLKHQSKSKKGKITCKNLSNLKKKTLKCLNKHWEGIAANQRMRTLSARDINSAHSVQVSARLPLINHAHGSLGPAELTAWHELAIDAASHSRCPSSVRIAQPNISWHKTAFILVLLRFIGFSIWFICVWQPPSPTLCSPNMLDICLLLVFTLHLHFDYVFAWDLWPLTPQERTGFIKNMMNKW